MNDPELFESGIEQIEKQVEEKLAEKSDAGQRQISLSEALAALSGDAKLESLLRHKLSDAESALDEVNEQIGHYRDVVRKISDELLQVHERNLHSREVLEQLESIGADVGDGFDVLHARQLHFDKCREQMLELHQMLHITQHLARHRSDRTRVFLLAKDRLRFVAQHSALVNIH